MFNKNKTIKPGDRVKSTVQAPAVVGTVTRRDGDYVYVEQDLTEREFEFYDCELVKLEDIK